MKFVKEYLTPIAMLVMSGVLLYDHFSPRPTTPVNPTVNGVALGSAYAPVLVAGYADAWAAAAKAIEDGKPVTEAQKVLQETWKDARVKAFKADVQPSFAIVLPEGTEPTDAAKRSQVADLWRSFAKGLRGGR
jgi:hypothetical protein